MRPRKRSDFVSLHECGSIQKADSVSLGIFTLRIMLPTNHWTHLHLSFANQSSLKWRELRIESPWEWHVVSRLHFPRKRSVRLAYLFDSSGLTGLEPAASALTGRCSDQLNYNPRELRDLAENVILFYPPYQVFMKKKGVLPSHGRLVNCWVELDLNQRRHIVANEFTVRPH